MKSYKLYNKKEEKKSFKEKIQEILKYKRVKYFGIAVILLIFTIALNIAFSSFVYRDTTAVANIKVAGMEYAMTIDSNPTRIVKGNANDVTIVEVEITAANKYASKYELIYKVCTTSSCSAYQAIPNDFEVQYHEDTASAVTGEIGTTGTKTITIAIINDTASDVWIELDINAGYAHNTLALEELIINEYIKPAPRLLVDVILEQGGGAEAIEAKGNPNFVGISTSLDTGLYAMVDDYGMSYYYRGLKTSLNNNLIFGGFQWKIVRINGDGSIRIIYNGTCPGNTIPCNGTGINSTHANTAAGSTSILNTGSTYTHAWNTSNYDDAKYIGYMYGGANGTASTQKNGTTSSAATYNETSSNAKVQLENWYQANIASKPIESKIMDIVFCNDRQSTTTSGGVPDGTGGYKKVSTTYGAYYRVYSNKIPTLICGEQNDRFTVNDVILGNGVLTYPIGLITADEVSMAGGVRGTPNNTYYLYTAQLCWTMSPFSMLGGIWAELFELEASGGMFNNRTHESKGLRPVINLATDVTVLGDGSTSSPFIVTP